MKCQPKAWNTDFLPTERGGRTGEYWLNVTALGPYRNNWGPIISWTAPASDTFELSNIWAGAFSFKTIAHCAKLTTNLQLDHCWFNIKQKCGRICYTIWRKKRSNILVTISLTNQLQVFIVEVLCLRSEFEDMLCNSTFSSKYIYPWELSPIVTAKIGASWKTPVCPWTFAHPARMDSGSVNWVILITFNILLTLNPKKDTSIGLQRYRYSDRTQYDRFIFQLSLVWLYWVFITINPTKGRFILAESMFKQPLFS